MFIKAYERTVYAVFSSMERESASMSSNAGSVCQIFSLISVLFIHSSAWRGLRVVASKRITLNEAKGRPVASNSQEHNPCY